MCSLLITLDAFALEGIKVEYEYAVLDNSGQRYDYLAIDLQSSELTEEQALELMDKIVDFYKANAKPHQRLGAMIEKMGFEEFAAAIIGD